MLKPNSAFEKVTDISSDFLINNNIKGIILDVDNTLIDLNSVPVDNIQEWIKKIKNAKIKVCIASNSLKKHKVENIAKILDVKYVFFSMKPLRVGLKKAKKILGLEPKYIAEIGDQLFTDVLGANRMKMFSIITKPISPEKHFLTELKRKIEKKLLSKYNINF